jgi:hypothetical protein
MLTQHIVCVFVALGIQHAMRIGHIVYLWLFWLYHIFLTLYNKVLEKNGDQLERSCEK